MRGPRKEPNFLGSCGFPFDHCREVDLPVEALVLMARLNGNLNRQLPVHSHVKGAYLGYTSDFVHDFTDHYSD